jgi:hypothetical protein
MLSAALVCPSEPFAIGLPQDGSRPSGWERRSGHLSRQSFKRWRRDFVMKLPDSIRSFQSNFLHLELLFENGRLSKFQLKVGLPVAFVLTLLEFCRILLHK